MVLYNIVGEFCEETQEDVPASSQTENTPLFPVTSTSSASDLHIIY